VLSSDGTWGRGRGVIVPRYWAEGRAQQRDGRRQLTVRRFGWSDESDAAAQAHADERAQAALAQALAGAKVARREPKVPYNGAEGVPIREQIVSQHGDAVVTRNAYGARCLNSPDVLFVDIDFDGQPIAAWIALSLGTLVTLAAGVGWATRTWWLAGLLAFVALLAAYPLALRIRATVQRARGGAEARARRRVEQFVAAHPDWHLRLYRTPAGLRVLALHRTFDPSEPAVTECFAALGADPTFVRMCQRQRCFRARVSPKPWRMGLRARLRPRPGVWPVAAARQAERERWIAAYELAARDYAACHFVTALGSTVEHAAARRVREWHDAWCQAASTLPLA
jgi:hypothetical protein